MAHKFLSNLDSQYRSVVERQGFGIKQVATIGWHREVEVKKLCCVIVLNFVTCMCDTVGCIAMKDSHSIYAERHFVHERDQTK